MLADFDIPKTNLRHKTGHPKYNDFRGQLKI